MPSECEIKTNCSCDLQGAAFEQLASLTRIPEVPGFTLTPATGHHESRVFRGIPQSLHINSKKASPTLRDLSFSKR
jgi:hypothetical protein